MKYLRGRSKGHWEVQRYWEACGSNESCGWDDQVELYRPYETSKWQVRALAQAHMLRITSFIIIKCKSQKSQYQRYKGCAKSTGSPHRTETNTSITIHAVRPLLYPQVESEYPLWRDCSLNWLNIYPLHQVIKSISTKNAEVLMAPWCYIG